MAKKKIFNRPYQTNTFETNDYNMFQHMTGNRIVKSKHMNELIDAMREKGTWIGPPAEVNENMEVGDGQHRIEAAKTLGIPVRYEVIEGLRINDARDKNKGRDNWDTPDYVKSYADQGYEDYIWILDTLAKYPFVKLSMLLELANGNGYHTDLKQSTKLNVYNGGLDIDEERREHVIDVLDFLSKFTSATKCIKGRIFMFYNALIWWRYETNCDIDRLICTVNKYANNEKVFPDKLSTEGFVYSIQEAYNYNRPNITRLYIKNEYDKFVRYEKK